MTCSKGRFTGLIGKVPARPLAVSPSSNGCDKDPAERVEYPIRRRDCMAPFLPSLVAHIVVVVVVAIVVAAATDLMAILAEFKLSIECRYPDDR